MFVPWYCPAAAPVPRLFTLTIATMGWSALATAEPKKLGSTGQSLSVRKVCEAPGAMLFTPQLMLLPPRV